MFEICLEVHYIGCDSKKTTERLFLDNQHDSWRIAPEGLYYYAKKGSRNIMMLPISRILLVQYTTDNKDLESCLVRGLDSR